MVKCPKCNEEIDFLNHYQSGENWYILRDDGEYETKEFIASNYTTDFECPECTKVLFTDEDKAREFIMKK